MADLPVDVSLWKWAIGLVSACVSGALGLLWRRIDAVDAWHKQSVADATAKLKAEIDSVDDSHRQNNRDVWTAIETNRKDHSEFKTDTLKTFASVTTKDDLQQMEHRLMVAIQTAMGSGRRP